MFELKAASHKGTPKYEEKEQQKASFPKEKYKGQRASPF
jgi:hypothetical protein